jgi:hypothetical protein
VALTICGIWQAAYPEVDVRRQLASGPVDNAILAESAAGARGGGEETTAKVLAVAYDGVVDVGRAVRPRGQVPHVDA